MTTSSTSPGSRPARRTACAITWPPTAAPCVLLKAPRYARPIGVRAVETMTASAMGSPCARRTMETLYRGHGREILRGARRGRRAGRRALRARRALFVGRLSRLGQDNLGVGEVGMLGLPFWAF